MATISSKLYYLYVGIRIFLNLKSLIKKEIILSISEITLIKKGTILSIALHSLLLNFIICSKKELTYLYT